METKTCTKCKEEKTLSEFNKNKLRPDGLHSWCNDCKSEYNSEYNKRLETKRSKVEYSREYWQRPEVKARRKEYEQCSKRKEYLQRPEVKARKVVRDKRSWMLRTYGITFEQKQQMIAKQNGRCAICKNKLDMGKNTCVDHDHKTGKVRGILCSNCNTFLGFGKDNSSVMRAAANYIDEYKK